MNEDIAVRLQNISKKYRLYDSPQDRMKEALHPFRKKYHRDFYALKDINLEIKKGEILGIVGRNGSGKSTLLKIISGVLTPTTGTVETKGRVSAILELGAGFNKEYTGLENIYHNLSINGFRKEQNDEKVEEIIDFSELGDFIKQPVKTYSSGMKAKLAFAVSTSVDPEILILDEVLSVGDALFQRKCFARMEKFFKAGKTVLFVSHSTQSVINVCSLAILIDKGKLLKRKSPKIIERDYNKLLFGGGISDRENDRKNDLEINTPHNLVEIIEDNLISNKRIIDDDPDNTPDQISCFLKNLKPKSSEIEKYADIEMYNYRIESVDKKVVNALAPGKSFAIKYSVNFNKEYKKIAFPVIIRTKNNLVVSGIRYPALGKELDIDDTKKQYQVEYVFKAIFTAGDYYVTFAIPSFDGGVKRSLLVLHDALMFRVLSNDICDENTHSWGLINSLELSSIRTLAK